MQSLLAAVAEEALGAISNSPVPQLFGPFEASGDATTGLPLRPMRHFPSRGGIAALSTLPSGARSTVSTRCGSPRSKSAEIASGLHRQRGQGTPQMIIVKSHFQMINDDK